MVKMTKYHCLPKYISIYHCFKNVQGSTTFWVFEFSILEFFEIITFKFAKIFLMELELMKLEYHKNFQNCSMENSSSPNLSTQKVVDPYIFLKQWQIDIYIYILVNNAIVPFWLLDCCVSCWVICLVPKKVEEYKGKLKKKKKIGIF